MVVIFHVPPSRGVIVVIGDPCRRWLFRAYFAPTGLGFFVVALTQGVALGYLRPPLWGFGRVDCLPRWTRGGTRGGGDFPAGWIGLPLNKRVICHLGPALWGMACG